jgi:phosphoribosylformylglycinamidine (FGAM) synthase-like enzyme
LSEAITKGYVSSCHDCSEGGAAVAISEMCIGGHIGANIFLAEMPQTENIRSYELLFSESPSRFIVEVRKENKENFEKIVQGVPYGLIGCVSGDEKLLIHDKNNDVVVGAALSELKQVWMNTFSEFR